MNPLFEQVRRLASAWHLPPAKKRIPNALSYRLADRSVVVDLESRTTLRISQTTGSIKSPTTTNTVRVTRVSERLSHHERALTQAIGHFMLLQGLLQYCESLSSLGKRLLEHPHSPANFIPVLLDDEEDGMFICKVCGDRFALATHADVAELRALFPDPLQWLRSLSQVTNLDFGSFTPRRVVEVEAVEIKTYGIYFIKGVGSRYLAPGVYVRGSYVKEGERNLERIDSTEFFERYHRPVYFDETPNRFDRSGED